MPYIFALTYADLESLKYHREIQDNCLKRYSVPLPVYTPCPHCMMMLSWQDSGTIKDTQSVVEVLLLLHSFNGLFPGQPET